MSLRFSDFIPALFVLLWSTGFITAKYALPFIEPFYLLFIRMSLTVAVFMLLCLLLRARRLNLRQIGHQLVSGGLIHGVYLGAVFAAIKLGLPAGITAIIVGVQPVLTALLAWVWQRQRLSRLQWLGLCLGFIGMAAVLVLSGRAQFAPFDGWALLAALVALIAISLGTLYQKRYCGGVDLLAGSFWQYVSAAALMALLAFAFETREVIWDMQLILALLWLIFGLSVAAVLLLMTMIRQGEATKVVSYFYLVAPVTSIQAWLLFGEKLSPLSVLAIIVTVVGVYLVVKKPVLRSVK